MLLGALGPTGLYWLQGVGGLELSDSLEGLKGFKDNPSRVDGLWVFK